MEKSDKVTIVVEAINSFGLNLLSKLVTDKKNVFFSPFSVSVTLSMLLRGARTETANELKKALNLIDIKLSDEEINRCFYSLLEICAANQEFFTLSTANAVVCRKGFEVFPTYISDLKDIYKALVMEMDNPSAAVKPINDWVNQNTNGKIPKVFDSLEDDVVLILLNCIYFKGFWEYQFNPERTHNEEFYNNGLKSNAKMIPFMFIKEKFLFAQEQTFTALELPYKGNLLSMLLLLPMQMEGLKILEDGLSTTFLNRVRSNLRSSTVEVTIPKFRLEYSKELIPTLKNMGVSRLFQRGADLTGLSKSNELEVSQVIHKAVVDVNEEGTEAAAVTAAVMKMYCLVINPQFKANHPFLFTIYDKKNNLIFFTGRIEEL